MKMKCSRRLVDEVYSGKGDMAVVIVHVKDKERDFKWTPEAWKMVRNWFRDVEEFLRFEGLDPRGHILPGSHYIYQIETLFF